MESESAAMRLSRREVSKLWRRTLIVALACAIAFISGLYGVAPGGQYTFASLEAQSWSPATYAWFFQSVGNAYFMLLMGIEFGILAYGIIGLPIAVAIALLLWLVPPLKSTALQFVALDWRWFIILVAAFWFCGLALTIRAGMNPGICC